MKKLKTTSFQQSLVLIFMTVMFGCHQTADQKKLHHEVDMSTLKKEIELRLRDYETHLKNGDSIALGQMYMANAEIIPSTVGRDNIIKAFGSMIRDSITGSSFKTSELWGNEDILVEDGTGIWSHANGTVVSRGRYLLVWKKEDGQWKILRDTWFPEKKN